MKTKSFFTLLLAVALCFYGCTKTEIVEIIVPGNSTEEPGTDEPDDNTPGGGSGEDLGLEDDEYYSVSGDGTIENPYTVSQALEMLNSGKYDPDKGYYVKGIVSCVAVILSWYGGGYTFGYYMSEDGTYTEESDFFVDSGFALGGEYFTSQDALSAGDKVIVYGRLTIDVRNNDRLEMIYGQLCYWNGVTADVNEDIEDGDDDDADEPDEGGDYELTGEGTAENPYTVADAVNIIINKDYTFDKVYVKGIISQINEIDTQSYGTAIYHISDDGETEDQFEIYLGYSLDGNKFTSDDEIAVGDEVVVYGELTVHNSSPRMEEGSVIYSIDRKTDDDDQQGDDRENDEYYEEPGEGTMDNPYTVSQIIESVENGTYDSSVICFVKGVVASISAWDGSFGWMSYYMSKTGTSSEAYLYVNEGYGLGGEKITTFNYMSKGDEIVVYGRISVTDDGAPEMVNGRLYYLNGEEAENVNFDDEGDDQDDAPEDDGEDVCQYMTDSYFITYCLENFDTNGNGKISFAEAEAVTIIDIDTRATDFTGIEYFVNLQSFTSKYAKTLDLSKNLELNYIYLASSDIENLDLRGNTKLVSLVSKAFNGCTSLREIYLPETLESIGANAFYGCSKLRAIEFPESLKSIGDYAFFQSNSLNSSLTRIEFSKNGATAIGDYAFGGHRYLRTLSLPENSVSSIGAYAFQGCSEGSGISFSITFPECLESIGDYAFQNFKELKTVTFSEDSATSIGDYAFSDCTKLESITFPENSVSSIGAYVINNDTKVTSLYFPEGLKTLLAHSFDGCDNLTYVSLPSTLTSMGDYSFRNCDGLETVSFSENSQTTLGQYAFYQCTNLTALSFPKNCVISIGYEAFYKCSGLNSISSSEGNEISMGKYAFIYCRNISSVCFSKNSIITFGEYAFYECGNSADVSFGENSTIDISGYVFSTFNLSSVLFPENSSITIGDRAFNGCSLTSVSLPESSSITIGNSAFSSSGLTSVTLPENVSLSDFGESVFAYCSDLTSATLPKSWSEIPYGVFNSCGSLSSVTIPENPTSIEDYAFTKCGSLTSFTFPESLTKIEYFAFRESGVTSAILSEGLTEIGAYAFYGSALTSVTLPNSLTEIGEKYVFAQCKSLTSVTLPEFLTTIGSYVFEGCSNLTSISLPETLTTIGEGGLSATGLVSVSIPEGITTIKSSTFYNCKDMTTLVLPASLTDVESHGFFGCEGLGLVTVKAITPPSLGYLAFMGVSSTTAELYTPSESTNKYRASDWIYYFTNIWGYKEE